MQQLLPEACGVGRCLATELMVAAVMLWVGGYESLDAAVHLAGKQGNLHRLIRRRIIQADRRVEGDPKSGTPSRMGRAQAFNLNRDDAALGFNRQPGGGIGSLCILAEERNQHPIIDSVVHQQANRAALLQTSE